MIVVIYYCVLRLNALELFVALIMVVWFGVKFGCLCLMILLCLGAAFVWCLLFVGVACFDVDCIGMNVYLLIRFGICMLIYNMLVFFGELLRVALVIWLWFDCSYLVLLFSCCGWVFDVCFDVEFVLFDGA